MAAGKPAVKSQQENQMDGKEKQKEMLVKVTARIAHSVSDIIKDIAEEYGVSFSEVVRLSIDGHLEKYLGNVQYIDKQQGEEIKRQSAALANEMQGIRNELNRIGVNVNQIAKGNNIAGQVMRLNDAYCASKDEKKKSEIIRKIMHLEKMQRELKVISSNLDAQKECMDRYEEASLEVAKALWHIQG